MSNNLTLIEYQKYAHRTCPDLGSLNLNTLHMDIGIITEIGEILDMYKKHIAYGKSLDMVNIEEEIADVCWYAVNRLRMYNLIAIVYMEPVPKTSISPEEVCKIIEKILYDFLNEKNLYELLNSLYNVSCLLGLNFHKALYNNIEKLKIRYPEKFTQENALNRDLKAEREKLEK